MAKKTQPDPAPDLQKRTSPTIEFLPVLFTNPERVDLAEQLARATQSKQDLEDQKKAQDASYKDDLEGLNLSIRRITRKLVSGHEMQNVQCKWIFETPTDREKTLVRMDTGEIVRVVPMQDHDYQATLPTAAPAEKPLADGFSLESPPVNGKDAAAGSAAN